ncbi:MAG: OmpA family protein [Rubrimonas sp.]
MRRPLLTILATMTALGGAAAFGWSAAGLIEGRLEARVSHAAQAAGMPWLRVDADGAVLMLSGEAPDANAAAAAAEIALGVSPFVSVVNAMELAAASRRIVHVEPSPPPLIEILRDENGAKVLGAAPGAEALERIGSALEASVGGAVDATMAGSGGGAAGRNWRLIEGAAVSAAAALSVGRVSLSPGSLSVTGLPASEEDRLAIERTARALRAGGAEVLLDLAPPRAAAGAAVIEVALSSNGLAVAACVAPDPSAATALTGAMGATLSDAGGAPCGYVGSTPDADWTRAAEAGLDALRSIGAGRIRLEGRRMTATLKGPNGSSSAAAARLSAVLPEGFVLTVEGAEQVAAPPAVAAGSVWMRVRVTPEVVLVTGAAPDPATRKALLSYAGAAFGAERAHDGMALTAAAAPEGWRSAALAAIDALHELDEGLLEVADGRVRVSGIARDPLSAQAVGQALEPIAARGWTVTTRVTVDLPSRAAEAMLSPAACAAALSAAVARSPILFEPSSADIDEGSEAVLDAMAATLRRCAEARIEIGGHTDSQGSVGYNLALSQSRAESVRAALIARGAPARRLIARGYGPSEPVADNATEEGRALNRRIAFLALNANADAEELPTEENPDQ